jgi:hypothetical protein
MYFEIPIPLSRATIVDSEFTRSVGILGEIRGIEFFARRGYEIFLPFNSNAFCDFIAYKNKQMFRVEVKTIKRNVYADGYRIPQTNPDNYDLLAIVLRNPDEVDVYDNLGKKTEV